MMGSISNQRQTKIRYGVVLFVCCCDYCYNYVFVLLNAVAI